MVKNISIFWFRQDLRLSDNPGFIAACQAGYVLPVFILDEENPADWSMGSAGKFWLHHSLSSLNKMLNGKLRFLKGNPHNLLESMAKKIKASSIFWNRCYEPWRISRDSMIKLKLKDSGYIVESFNGSLLWEPWEIVKSDKTPYKVFTPYYRKGCLNARLPRTPQPVPNIKLLENDEFSSNNLSSLNLLPNVNWGDGILESWKIGELAANERLKIFLNNGLIDYKEGRNFPNKNNVSRLSPYLHWGEISINTVWYSAKARAELSDIRHYDIDHFLSELGWREFSNSLLYNFPELPIKNLQERFNNFPWEGNLKFLKCWQKGETGYPIVDAGMRQLWKTGYMHNRLRMIVGSFLVKNLLIDWRHGERWFWDCLVDADLANNSASWQWIAGCGADAAPYFRIFNPITQGQKFDSEGVFVRQFVPEIASLPNQYIFNPWEAPEELLTSCGIGLNSVYRNPIVNLKDSREAALAAFSKLKSGKDINL